MTRREIMREALSIAGEAAKFALSAFAIAAVVMTLAASVGGL